MGHPDGTRDYIEGSVMTPYRERLTAGDYQDKPKPDPKTTTSGTSTNAKVTTTTTRTTRKAK